MHNLCKGYAYGLLITIAFQALAQSAPENSLRVCLDESLTKQIRKASCLFAAELGDLEAQFQLGKLYESERETDKALNWCRIAAERGHVEAQHYLGDWYYPDSQEPNDPEEALKWYRMASNNGHAGAQFNLGQIYLGWEQGDVTPFSWTVYGLGFRLFS